MNNEQELKAHLQDNNKARTYEEKKLQKVMKEYAKTVTKEQDELKTYMVEASHTQHASYEIKVKAKNKIEANKIALAKHIYDWSALDLVNEDGLSVDATEEIISDEHKKKEDDMIRNWNEEIAMNKGGQ